MSADFLKRVKSWIIYSYWRMVISHQGGLICHNIPIVRIPIVRWMTINSIHLLTMARIKLIVAMTIPIIP